MMMMMVMMERKEGGRRCQAGANEREESGKGTNSICFCAHRVPDSRGEDEQREQGDGGRCPRPRRCRRRHCTGSFAAGGRCSIHFAPRRPSPSQR